jgi:hypothetical protein
MMSRSRIARGGSKRALMLIRSTLGKSIGEVIGVEIEILCASKKLYF